MSDNNDLEPVDQCYSVTLHHINTQLCSMSTQIATVATTQKLESENNHDTFQEIKQDIKTIKHKLTDNETKGKIDILDFFSKHWFSLLLGVGFILFNLDIHKHFSELQGFINLLSTGN